MAQKLNRETLLKARVQHGHLSRKWHPECAPFIFMKKNKTHVINLDKTLDHLQRAAQELKKITEQGGKILFVARKKQARDIIQKVAQRLEQPYVILRWLGGFLTNFNTNRKLLKNLAFPKEEDETYEYLTKREKLMKARKRAKQKEILGGLLLLNRLPAALFVVDVNKEITAIKEARKLDIPVFGLLDTNASPKWLDFPIPANDDARNSIHVITDYLATEMEQGIQLWKKNKETEDAQEE